MNDQKLLRPDRLPGASCRKHITGNKSLHERMSLYSFDIGEQ